MRQRRTLSGRLPSGDASARLACARSIPRQQAELIAIDQVANNGRFQRCREQ
jgi:hypothetical protein